MGINNNIDSLLIDIEINEISVELDANWGVSHGLAAASIVGASAAVVGGAALAIFGLVAGAKAFASYLNSIGRLKSVIKGLQLKLQKEKNPVNAVKIRTKINDYQTRLRESQAKARLKKADFIKETRLMQQELNKARIAKDQPAVLKLQTELQNRQKVLSKIGAL